MVSQTTTNNPNRKCSNVFLGYANGFDSCKAPADGTCNVQAVRRQKPFSGFNYWLLFLLVTVGVLIKCVEGRFLMEETLPTDWDCRDYPCFCDEVFFRYCPDKDYCKVKRMPRYSDHIPPEFAEPANNIFDPDHIYPPGGFYSSRSDLGQNNEEDMPRNNGKIVTLRKVKVDDPDSYDDVQIHPIKVKIPVRVDDEMDVMPPVKSKYRMREYTTQESKLETDMVPVTETVIKPVGISRDQIVDDMTS